MIHAASAEFLADFLCRGQTKVGDSQAQTTVEAEDILWLQIAMVNAKRVTIFNGIQNLQKDVLDKAIVTKVSTLMQDLGKQVTIRAVVHHDEGTSILLNHSMEADDVRMERGKLVKSDLLHLKAPLSVGAGL